MPTPATLPLRYQGRVNEALPATYGPRRGLVLWVPVLPDARDLSGFNRHGTVTGAALTTDRLGRKLRAYNLDGDDFISFGEGGGAFDFGTGPFSVAFRILRTTSVVTNQRALNKGGNADNDAGYAFFGSDTDITFIISQGDGTPRTSIAATIAINTWYHVVGTRNGATMKLYLNGVLAASRTNGLTGSLSNALNLILGRHSVDAANFWTGKVSDVRLIAREWQSYEVMQLYKNVV